MLAPVLLFTYKRPDHTMLTLDALTKNILAEQTHLFVFSDGSKNESDRSAIEAVRKLVRETSGFASITLIERSENMGLARSIITGVSEILKNHDSVIVLEDDLVTSKYFLTYMNNALDHYKNDPYAFSVTGHTFPEKFLHIPDDYPYDTYVGYRCSSWSWGTWRDRWQRINWKMDYFPAFDNDAVAQEKFNQGGQDMATLLRMQYTGQIDSWAIRFCYAHYANRMKCIYPTLTLVMNIGLDNSGTHSKPDERFLHLRIDESFLPMNYCPASNINKRITDSFKTIFDPPKPGRFCLLYRKSREVVRIVKNRIIEAARRIKRILMPPVQDVEVLVVNTYQKNGGAARAAYRMFCGIRRIYINTRYLTLFRDDWDQDVIGLFNTSIRGVIAQRLVRRDQAPLRAYSGRPATFFSPAQHPNFLRVRLSSFRSKLVHLHWVCHSMLRVEEIGRLRCPVVWTLHDTWAFTGGCHYTGECNGYTKTCGACPQLSSQKMNDISYSLWLKKQRAWANINLTVVTPSKWLADVAMKSSLFAGRHIRVIPNGLDTEAFKPIDKYVAKQYLALSGEQPVLLFGAHWLADPRKGGDLLCQALAKLDFSCVLLTFGEGRLELKNMSHVTVRALGSLTDDISLAMMYSAADVFICPSREDNLPNTVAEALACGTPCAAFNVNGLPDMIDHQKNGWLAKPFDSTDLAEGIKWLVQHPQPELLQSAAREHAVAEYSMAIMTKRYTELYAELLGAGVQ